MTDLDPDLAATRDIVQAAREIATFVSGLDLEGFLGDQRTQGAVIHRLILIGEATKRLSMEFRDRHSNLPWKEMAGTRDVLVHAYHRVVLVDVWTIATVQVPDLPIALDPLLKTSND